MLHTKVKPHSWCDYVTRITMLYQSVDLSVWVCRVSNLHILSCYLSQIHPHNLYTNLLTRIELLNIGYILTIYAENSLIILEYTGQWSSQTQAIVTAHHLHVKKHNYLFIHLIRNQWYHMWACVCLRMCDTRVDLHTLYTGHTAIQ